MPDRADLKQRALRLAAEALDDLRPGATDWEMQETAKQAVQPVVQEYEHDEACKLILACVNLPGATSEELQDARDATKEALAELPIGAGQRQLEEARDLALAPIQKRIEEREERNRDARDRSFRRFRAELHVDTYLDHIKTYLKREFEFDGGHQELSKEADRLREPVRKQLVLQLIEEPDMEPDDIRARIEDLVEELDDR
jgi:hypothetical protein